MLTLRVGLIADIQHADIDDASSAHGRTRYYRDGPVKAELAAQDWAAQGCLLAVNLGDTIDRRAGHGARMALTRVLSAFGTKCPPVMHVLGNHDLSALSAKDLAQLTSRHSLPGLEAVAGPGLSSDILVGPGWRLLLLDTYDIAVRREGMATAARDFRERLLQEARKRRESAPWLSEHEELNGAVGPEQLQWVKDRLCAAAAAQERVVVLAHASLLPEVTYFRDAVCWNGPEVAALLDSFGPSVVPAVFTGHDHFGMDGESKTGIYHRVLEAAMEGPLGTPTHAVLELRADGIALRGSGKVRS